MQRALLQPLLLLCTNYNEDLDADVDADDADEDEKVKFHLSLDWITQIQCNGEHLMQQQSTCNNREQLLIGAFKASIVARTTQLKAHRNVHKH